MSVMQAPPGNTQARIRVIGRRRDITAIGPWPGCDVLDVPDEQWSERLNTLWIQEGIAAGQRFRVISPMSPENLRMRIGDSWRKTAFALELELLEAAGYVRVGDFWVPGGAGARALGGADPFVQALDREPLAVYARIHHRAQEAARRGESSFPFPELAPTVQRMRGQLRRMLRSTREPLPSSEVESLLALEARAEALLTSGTPYPELLRFTVDFVEQLERRARAHRPGLAELFVPKCREELEPLLHLWPEVLAFPTFSALDRRFFWRTRSVPIHALGLITRPRYTDGQECSPAEYFFHDVDHVRFLVREELLARGIDIPDVYRSADTYAPASTFDPVRRRHRTLLDIAHGAVKSRGLEAPERLAERGRLAQALDARLAHLRGADPSLGDAASWLLFEIIHEKGFPMGGPALREQLARDSHPTKLRSKFAAGFYGEGAVPVSVAQRLDEARDWLQRQVRP
jgi:hypothetical protein